LAAGLVCGGIGGAFFTIGAGSHCTAAFRMAGGGGGNGGGGADGTSQDLACVMEKIERTQTEDDALYRKRAQHDPEDQTHKLRSISTAIAKL
jgi:hypothetical protein